MTGAAVRGFGEHCADTADAHRPLIKYPRKVVLHCAGAGVSTLEIPTTEVELTVAESSRHGAPMTMVRGGEERDWAAVVAMGQVRAGPFRFHLDRDVDLVQYAITKKRLLAGLGSAGARQLHFFIAEKGITAAAYIVVSIVERTWTIEE
jgi:hypothetical protein